MFADCALSEGVSEQAEGWRRARASTTSRSSTRAPPKPEWRGRKARRAARPRSAHRAQALGGYPPLASAARGEAAARSRVRRRRLAGYPPRAHCPPLAWRHPPPLRRSRSDWDLCACGCACDLGAANVACDTLTHSADLAVLESHVSNERRSAGAIDHQPAADHRVRHAHPTFSHADPPCSFASEGRVRAQI